ncbi:DNA mismatch repair endonuclease MutL [Fulvivirgaceae bacterium BMA10]|uniref:DNA mismatch repair protein MutL n=1 Tax=Splendidivirga corallicola TaxID=3051826 RepID=A0ABT8KTL4_9BACT|nr:DNA mismatch repair endonuclease MutL [Fulvivirgaceae bacterium BMA10]
MSDIIQLLPDSIANQIAAGEVVQRPASAVKELLENSIDAGSTNIKLIVKEAGKSLIQVIDNGAGMSENDARMSFERHATSKLRKSEDLFSIRTMGFRGEALASIAAISQVELKTKQDEEELGTLLQIDGSELKKHEAVSCKTGTSICVKNLFYNVPARRNFLKSNPVELKHIIDEFVRIALANPDIHLSFMQNDLEVYNLPPGKLSHRIVNIFGKNYKEQLATCEENTSHINIRGYIGKPEFAKKTRGEQFFFANNRFIKSSYLNHAVLNAYEGLLPENHHPFYVLFIEIDPKHIDINVHPTKTEIKFEDERTMYAIIRSAVKQALGTHNITPTLDFEQDANFQSITSSKLSYQNVISAKRDYEQFKKLPREKSNLANWEKLFDENKGWTSFESENQGEEPSKEITLTFESAANKISSSGSGTEKVSDFEEKSSITQIHHRYIMTQVKSGIMLIDQEVAHERILFEKFSKALENKSGASQQYLFPQTLELSPADYALVMELKEEIQSLGFVFNEFGKSTIVINGGPADITGTSEKELFEGLIEQFKKNKAELSLEVKENMARSIAKRSGIKAGQALTGGEMNALIDQLFACENPNYSPNGQLTFFILSLDKIANFFNK